jgi:hypothetical protein
MLSWLVAAEAFRLAYPAARRGRKVAYLTLAGFVFLVITLAAFLTADSMHGQSARDGKVQSPPVPSPLRGGLGRGLKRVQASITPPLTPPRQGEGNGGDKS